MELLIIWLFVVSCAIAAESRERARIRGASSRGGECAQCGYDLAGLAPVVACPECGCVPSAPAGVATASGVLPTWQLVGAMLAQCALVGLVGVRDQLNLAIRSSVSPPLTPGVCQTPWFNSRGSFGPADAMLFAAALSPLIFAIPKGWRARVTAFVFLSGAGLFALWVVNLNA